MDWLSKRKFVIVCHEKVVRIPLEGDEILWVHGERTQGVVKTLVNTKSNVKDRYWLLQSEDVQGRERLPAEMLCDLGPTNETRADDGSIGGSEKDEGHASRLRWMIYLVVLADAAESVRDAIGFELTSCILKRMDKVNVIFRLWVGRYNQGQCVIDFGSSYHLSIRCAPFEALYGIKCSSPVLMGRELDELCARILGIALASVAVIMCYMVIDCDVIRSMALCSIGVVYVVRSMALCLIGGVLRTRWLLSNWFSSAQLFEGEAS
ncbi:hypothetical protein Tco_1352051 [Tanacetum coccineum]